MSQNWNQPSPSIIELHQNDVRHRINQLSRLLTQGAISEDDCYLIFGSPETKESLRSNKLWVYGQDSQYHCLPSKEVMYHIKDYCWKPDILGEYLLTEDEDTQKMVMNCLLRVPKFKKLYHSVFN